MSVLGGGNITDSVFTASVQPFNGAFGDLNQVSSDFQRPEALSSVLLRATDPVAAKALSQHAFFFADVPLRFAVLRFAVLRFTVLRLAVLRIHFSAALILGTRRSIAHFQDAAVAFVPAGRDRTAGLSSRCPNRAHGLGMWDGMAARSFVTTSSPV